MRTITYQDEELTQFVAGEDWFVFTTDLVIHAPFERLLAVVDEIYTNRPHIIFLHDLELLNAMEDYKEEHYPESYLPD